MAVGDGIVELLMNRSGVNMLDQFLLMLHWHDRVPYCKPPQRHVKYTTNPTHTTYTSHYQPCRSMARSLLVGGEAPGDEECAGQRNCPPLT